MGKTCAVAFCNSGYKTNAKIKMHTFPADESEREKWVNALPNIFSILGTGSYMIMIRLNQSPSKTAQSLNDLNNV